MLKKSFVVNKNLYSVYKKNKNKKYNYQKVLWSSKISMTGRYWLLNKLIKNKSYNNWLDIGTGTGDIYKYINKNKFQNIDALEPINHLFKIVKKNNSDINIYNQTLSNFKIKNKYNLVSCIGVIQNCGSSPLLFLKKVCKIIQKNGYLYLTSKNINWAKFKSEDYNLELDHSWFDIEEIKKILKNNNLKIIKSDGFLPKEKKIVNYKLSHTFFIWARKN